MANVAAAFAPTAIEMISSTSTSQPVTLFALEVTFVMNAKSA
jgi:hypothetical protein